MDKETYIEVDDGQLSIFIGDTIITVHAETAIVYNPKKDLPAKRVPIDYSNFLSEIEDYW